jgi:hypothetical protein
VEITGFAWSVLLAAAGVGFIHTVLGPDHYLPFVMIGRARRWSPARTAGAAALCGIAHVASSLVLGWLGIGLGWSVARLEAVEGGRGGWAAWSLVAFGLAYAVWGARKAIRSARGIEAHAHGSHVHAHAGSARPHTHAGLEGGGSVAFWSLFTVFVLGPCEPLIPLFLLPASRGEWGLAATAATVFGVVTVGSMTAIAFLGATGLARLRLGFFERHRHALSGAVIAASGLAVLFLGL